EETGEIHVSVYNILYNKYEIIGDEEIDFLFDILFNDKTFVESFFSESLFNECYEKLGALSEDEVYGFVHLPVLGGDKTLEYAQKVKLNEYLSICAQSQM
ncbi:MAG: DUF1851 domain-containing protein, partial [Spirochaetales bacterium]|nr:DUF1851 domain-containing protein [Spirochaetales bacterium]